MLADIIVINLQELAYVKVTVAIGYRQGTVAISCELVCTFMTLLAFVSMCTYQIYPVML